MSDPKQETLRGILAQWEEEFADPDSPGYDASTAACYNQLALIMERLERAVEKLYPITCDKHDYQCECHREFNFYLDELREILGRKE